MNYIYGIEYNQILMTILIGVSISMLLYEKKGILTGGIIVPSIIAIFITKIIYVATTILMVIILHYIITYLRKHIILYGRRLFSLVLILGIGLVLLSQLLVEFIHHFGFGMYIIETKNVILLPFLEIEVPQLIVNLGFGMHYYGYVIGLLIVPIIVNDTQTQGLTKTLVALISVAVLTFILVSLIIILNNSMFQYINM